MALHNTPFNALEERDLQDLIENQVRETQTIEYKLTLPGNKESEKKEFLADVCSFANAVGGANLARTSFTHVCPRP